MMRGEDEYASFSPHIDGIEMPEPVQLLAITAEPFIDYNQFLLFDVESQHSRSDLPQRGDAIGVSGAGGATFFTLGEMTDVVAEFELWTDEPARPHHAYEQEHEGTFTVETGRLVLGCTTGAPSDVLIEVPAPGPFKLRAFRTSQATLDPEFPEIDHHDEQWLIQVWPAN